MSRERRLVEFIADERAATAIEYCVIGAMLLILILVGAQLIGVNISGRFLGPLVAGFPRIRAAPARCYRLASRPPKYLLKKAMTLSQPSVACSAL